MSAPEEQRNQQELPPPPPAPSCLLRTAVNWERLSLVTLFVIAIFAVLWVAKHFFLPFSLALLLAFVLQPVQRFARRAHVPSAFSAGLILILVFLILATSVFQLAQPAKAWLKELPRNAEQIRTRIVGLSQPVEDVQELAEQVQVISDVGKDESVPTVEVKTDNFRNYLISASQTLGTQVFLTLAFLFFFLAYGEALAGGFSPEGGTLYLVNQVATIISSYLFTITMINIGLGVCVGLALYFLGVPNAALWGVMAAIANFIPYIGAIIGEAVVLLVALMTFDDPIRIIAPPLAYFIINSLEGHLVTPMILGKRFTINPLIIFVSMIWWGWMWGVVGAMMAVPLLIAFKIFCDHFQPLYKLGQFISLEEPHRQKKGRSQPVVDKVIESQTDT